MSSFCSASAAVVRKIQNLTAEPRSTQRKHSSKNTDFKHVILCVLCELRVSAVRFLYFFSTGVSAVNFLTELAQPWLLRD
jgi:hypothetical protein